MRTKLLLAATIFAAASSLATSTPARAQDPAALAPLPPANPPAAPPPPPVSSPAPRMEAVLPPAPPMVPARAVWVHVNADRLVMLQHLAPFDTRWTEACLSPCDTMIPLDGTYRVVAPGIVWSREVELEAAPGERVVLDVHPRTLAQHRTAERLVIASYIVGAVGLGLEIGALGVNSDAAQTGLIVGGAGAAAAALALVITSFVMGGPTGLSQSSSAPASAMAPGRSPEGPRERDVKLPVATTVPLFRAAF